MKLTSPAFQDGQTISRQYTCQGQNSSPPLAIADVPEDAKSLVLIVDDPDAPAGTWTHWVVWNIDPATTTIEEGSTPTGASEGTASNQKAGYHGPCPPRGEHRYQFHLFALDMTIDLPKTTTAIELRTAMEDHILAETMLTGRYEQS